MKRKQNPNWLDDMLKDVDRGTVIGERWFVEEYRKPWYDSGYYGEGNMPETPNVEWSEFFDKESQARAHMKRVEPRNKDHALRIRHQKLYEQTVVTRTWRG